MDIVSIKICDEYYYCYGSFLIGKIGVSKRNCYKRTRKKCKISLDAAFVHYFVREFHLSPFYCRCFLTTFYSSVNNETNRITIRLLPTKSDLIDYGWNERIDRLVRERCELDHTFSWLSTLGGAFSALGDYFSNCAKMAGKISFHQLHLGIRLGDPNLAARCKLYFSLSLIQRRYFKLAKRIIYDEYCQVKKATIVDERLVKMCKGIWSKLQYDKQMYNIKRNKYK